MKQRQKEGALRAESKIRHRPRRSFLKFIWTSLGLVALAEVIFLYFSFLLPPGKNQKKQGTAMFPAGAVGNYRPGSVTAFTRGFFYLACQEDGGFLAYSSRCTHLGCTLPWNENEKLFICPCHASSFDIRGLVVSAPAPRPLDRYRVKIENGMIYVDTSRKIKRKEFHPGDVVYADQVKTGDGEQS
ncbi:MAG: Rieske (2Fe-2S) protein [Desulfobacterales bacterium]|nr:Rieske (2Fe-2S) protein [Desulfobacterales bacterium]